MPETAEWSVGLAQANDLDWLADNDHHIPPSTIEAKVRAGEYLVARTGSERIGGMRFGLFWSNIPIVEMIWVSEGQRRKGIGRAFIEWLEDLARSQNCPIILSSSEEGETESHAFHRGAGFRRAGVLEDMGRFQSAAEVFFVKDVSA